MGLIGIVTWIIPIVGCIICGIGISSGLTGMKSSKKGRATAGFVLSVIFLVFSILFWVLGILLNFLPFR